MAFNQVRKRQIGLLMRATVLAVLVAAACPLGVAWANPPQLIISNPVDGSMINNQAPAFEGETDDSIGEVVVNIYAGTSTAEPAVQTVTALPTLGAWSTGPVQALADGLYTAVASQEDLLLQETGTSLPVQFTVDTQAPAVTLNEVASPTTDATPSFNGAAGTAPGDVNAVELSIYAGVEASGSPLRTIPIVPNGATWDSGPIGALPDGTYTAQVEQSDQAGNVAFATPSTFTVDTAPPEVAIASPPDGTVTSSKSQKIEGAAGTAVGDQPSVTVELFAGASIGVQAPEATVVVQASGGKWSTTFGNLSDGPHTARAKQSDEAGNTGQSGVTTFTVDTVAPTPSLNALTSPTSDATPSFSGKAGAAGGDVAQVKLKLYTGGAATGTPLRNLTFAASGANWTSGPIATLADGTYTAQVEQSDSAGNVGHSSTSTFRIDTTPPIVTLTSPANGSFTKNTSPHIEGAAGTAVGDQSSVTVELFAGASIGAQAPELTLVVQASAGKWSATLGGLSEGAYTVRAAQSDNLGNGGQSAPVSFTVDTIAPAVSLSPVTSPTTNTTPSFSGNAGTATGDTSQVKVKIYAGNSASGAPLQNLQTNASGGSWTAGPATALGEGTYTAQAEQSDQAGNVGKSTASKFTVKTKGPKVTLIALAPFIDTATPTFKGQAGVATGDLPAVTVKIYGGEEASGTPLREAEATLTGATWSLGPVPTLPDGTYTAQAEQSDELHDRIVTDPSTFTVDTVAPAVSMATILSPSSNSTPVFNGAAADTASDTSTVTVKLYSGENLTGALVQSVQTTASGGAWTASPAAALGDGTYTAQAQQSDRAGNTGKSSPVTFTVFTSPPPITTTETATTPTPAPPDAAPVASFTWFPPTPNTGESIALVSNSTDASSPITAYAWSVGGTPFQAGGSVLSTSFATAGNHTVRLRVTAADGLSSTVSETIPVVSARVSLMQPFPIVRIAGSDTSKGVRIKLLSVQAPAGAKISVKCRGRGCPSKLESRVASSSAVGVTVIEFRHFERALRAGIVLEIRVSKAGQIGKYTRFHIRRNKLPQRLDTCLSVAGVNPTKCPSS
jgi:large repetitive protein